MSVSENENSESLGDGYLGSISPGRSESVLSDITESSSKLRSKPARKSKPKSSRKRRVKQSSKTTRCKAYCFTSNNYTANLVYQLKSLFGLGLCDYIVFQPERGLKGTPHLQGAVYFKNGKTLSAATKVLGRSSLTKMLGSFDQNYQYCTKKGPGGFDESAGFPFFVAGKAPVNVNTKGGGDIENLMADIKLGLTEMFIMEKYPMLWLRYERAIRKAINMYRPRRITKQPVRWYYGPTGTGKTLSFLAEFPDGFFKPGNDRWWDDFDGSQPVVIDDFRQSIAPFHVVLNLFDRYPMQVEGKGYMIKFCPKIIVSTSPQHPEDLYHLRKDEDLQQLIRRIDEIRYFPSPAFPTSELWRAHCQKNHQHADPTAFVSNFNHN